MTASGTTHVETPIAGIVELALRDPSLQEVARRAAERPVDLAVVGPAGARVFVASALAQASPLLVVTATGREADDLTTELRGVFGDAVAMFPSWETLPHERLSPGVDTVGARMMLLRRLSHPDDESPRPAAAGRRDDDQVPAAADGARCGRHRAGDADRRCRARVAPEPPRRHSTP